MHVVDLIHKKREGQSLTRDEIFWLINEYTAERVPDYQLSAFCMAVYFRGMTQEETVWLTEAMMYSGDTVDLSLFGDLSADKHSTGGVGDKTTLIVAPIVASLGGKMAKMSGRGLGHTGGTVDKLESIRSFQVQLSPENFLRQVQEVGLAVIGQSGNLTPADKKLYALRDVTDTVDSLPLIASSIMSKKLAAGSKNIVLDVKVGSGAFMKTPEDAKALAEQMVSIGKACGRNICAVLTDMDIPLGYHVGNALEVMEAIQVLRGQGPNDLKEVCMALASNLLSMVRGVSLEEAEALVKESLSSGKAYETFIRWIAAQGGDVAMVRDLSLLPGAKDHFEVTAPRDGYIGKMDTSLVGKASCYLGAGRETKDDPIDYGAGLVLQKKTGDFVRTGETLAVLYANDRALFPKAREVFLESLTWTEKVPPKQLLILGIIR